MKPVLRFFIPLVVILTAWGLAQLYFSREENKASRPVVSEQPPTKDKILALRIAAVDAAKRAHQVSLETERVTYEQEKKAAEFPEIAELSHTVRTLRIDLEYQTTLAGIDKQYPPPNPPAAESPPPETPAP